MNTRSKEPRRVTRLTNLARAAVLLTITAVMLVAAPGRRAQESPCAPSAQPTGCFVQARYDIAFILDRSGSIADRGQTYNIELEGVIRAISDSTVIPRNGTVAVAVFSFAGDTVLHVPLTEINADTDIQGIIDTLEALRCQNIGSLTPPCPTGETKPATAIQVVDTHMSQNRRQNVRRVLLFSTDGRIETPDLADAIAVANQSHDAATILGIEFELDAFLVGLAETDDDFVVNKGKVDSLVVPAPPTDLPGATFVINGGECNQPGASFSNPDCLRQATDFAEFTRDIIRREVSAVTIEVNTTEDTAPGEPVTGDTVSLRQALEQAVCNGGEATITFGEAVRGQTIMPVAPLPSITQPDVIIDGCEGEGCTPSVTIDGSQTDTTLGEAHGDGLRIRSNRTTIRGLRIINFPASGISFDPICPDDVVVRNLVELNVFENNAAAGVTVKNPDGSEGNISVGNTISRNTISGSATPIDLGGDGPTPNDEDDADEGPNTLLNFPEIISVIATDDTVTVDGIAEAPNARVEIFGVTSFTINEETDRIVITGVTFLAEATTDAEGSFTAEGVPVSPTGIYTATLTDSAGNTSELLFESDDTGPARSDADVDVTVDFGNVQFNTTPPPTRQVVITNQGTAPLIVTGCMIASCSPNFPDHTARFQISGCPTGPINPGEQVTINVTFIPTICGPSQVCLILTTNDPKQQQLSVQITANVTGPALAEVQIVGGGSVLDFGRTNAGPKPKKVRKQPVREFSISNRGCETLTITFAEILRTGAAVNNGSISNPDDSRFFTIVRFDPATGVEIPVNLGSALTVPSNGQFNFRARFNPVIPAVAGSNTGLAAREVLPDVITSQIIINQNAGSPITIDIVARVNTAFRLIDPTNPRQSPVIRLTRAGLDVRVEFSVYDSNQDVNRATYEFFDDRGRRIGNVFDINLSGAIDSQDLVRGQSFTVAHDFGASRDTLRVHTVKVTVFDGETSQSRTSGPVVQVAAAQRR